MEYDAGGDAQVRLILRTVAEFIETRQQVIHLNRANREVVRDVNIHASAESHREGIIRSGEGEAVAASDVRYAEKNLAKRREARVVPVLDTRTEEVCGERAVHARTENVAAVVAAKIGDAA